VFPLVRNFVLLSAVAIAVLTIALLHTYQRHTYSTLVFVAERQNLIMARSLANSIRPEDSSFHMTVEGLNGDALRASRENRKFRDAIAGLAKDLPTLKVQLFNLDGLSVYSSDFDEIGKTRKSGSGFTQSVRSGVPSSKLLFDQALTGLSGSIENVDVVRSQIPLRDESGAVRGVFELDYNVSSPVKAFVRTRRNIAIAMVAVFSFLYAVFFLVIRRAEAILKRQYRAHASSNKRLQSRVARRSAELERVNDELKESQRKLVQAARLSDLGQLSATISHEIRNPLSVIRTAIHVIRQKANAAGIDFDRPLDRAQRSVARCDDIVNDLLEYTRSNELKKVTVDSSRYLNELLDEQPIPFFVTLEREFPVPGLKIDIDCDRFRRVIINLISNAVEAIKEGGIEDGEITVTCLPDEGEGPSIHIKNNGPAIPEEVIARMYEPLYTTKSTGSGIGLPTVKKLIEQHGAELRVETKAGVGTTWSIIMQPMVNDGDSESRIDAEAMAA